jgi:hypothetical protein
LNTTNGLASVKEIFGFSFRDPKWGMKYLLGSALIFAGTVVPVLPWLPVLGYAARIFRRAAGSASTEAPEAAALPEWDDWNRLFIDGLRQFGVGFILSLPLALLMTVGYGLYFLSFIVMMENGDPGAILLFTFFIFWLTLGLSILLSPLTMLVTASAQAHVAVQQDFSAFLRVGEWWRILRSNLGGFLIVQFFLFGMYMVMMFAFQMLYFTLVLCCLVPFVVIPAGFYILVVYYHTCGLAYGEGRQRLESTTLVVESIQSEPSFGDTDMAAGI